MRKIIQTPWLWVLASLALMALIYRASDRTWDTDSTGLRLPPGSANLVHFVLYSVLTTTWGLALGVATKSPALPMLSRPWLLALSIASAFGLMDEWHQDFVEGRTCSLFDAIENGLGGVFGALATSWLLSATGLTRLRIRWLAGLAILGAVVALFAARVFPVLDACLSRHHLS